LSTSNMQTDSVSNQREHLILLLANIHIRGNPKTDQQSKVLFCKYSTTKLISFKNSYFSSCFTTFKFFLFLLMFFLFSLKLTTSSYMILVAVGWQCTEWCDEKIVYELQEMVQISWSQEQPLVTVLTTSCHLMYLHSFGCLFALVLLCHPKN
jgi:hypothetical protein